MCGFCGYGERPDVPCDDRLAAHAAEAGPFEPVYDADGRL